MKPDFQIVIAEDHSVIELQFERRGLLRKKAGPVLRLLRIPAGCFRMGSNSDEKDGQPAHWVRIKRDFWLGETPVTQAQYLALVAVSGMGLKGNPSHFEGDDRPVEQVSWEDCQSLCRGFNRSCGDRTSVLPAGLAFGLPTEAQWEYACRGETDTDYYSGDGVAALKEAGWYGDNSKGGTKPVGALRPNAYGLYDLHGNVWEWCLDAWASDAYRERGAEVADPSVSGGAGSLRVLRGGSWGLLPSDCRSAIRHRDHPGIRFGDCGFRLCVSSGPVENQQAVAGGPKQAAITEGAGAKEAAGL